MHWNFSTIGFLGLATLLLTPLGSFAAELQISTSEAGELIHVRRSGGTEPILTQHAGANSRPFLHPLVAPDGKGVLTELSPTGREHQTGIFWGFTRLNGRDYFHHPGEDYWRRVDAKILKGDNQSGWEEVRWQTVYELLNEAGQPVLRETQIWTMRAEANEFVLDLQWTGEGLEDVTIGRYDYGGLFVRMPWRPEIDSSVVNAARQRNGRAEGQRAPWVDIAMQVEGRDDRAHIAIFDHSKNPGFPQPWRVDKQQGVGPVRARLGDWQIARGEKVLIRHQLRVYTGTLNDVELTEKWARFSGQRGTAALWGIAQQEGRTAKFLTADEAVEAMAVPEGFRVNAWAHEPMMTQPMAFCWDDRGRLWIAENRDYETRGRGFSRSGDSRILILEDRDRDGVADSRKVFLEGIPFPAAIAVGFDGLWLGAPPNLLFVPDRNHDDRADLDAIEVRLTGWGIRDRHETLNSFHWGPDGWLYGCQGFATPSRVGKPAGEGRIYRHGEPFPDASELTFREEPTEINGGVWRYHPTKDRFEVVAHGFSNPWGLDYDAKGQLFISACVIPHLWHVIPGGIYHRQGGSHFSPYIYSDIRTIADHRHRSAHGGARVYLSDAFPDRYQGQIFMANIHEHAVLVDELHPAGSGFVGKHGEDFLLANNAQWIGFSMEIGPDGSVYVLDWHDADICGKEVLNKDTGRIFRIAPTESHAEGWPDRYADLASLPDLRLAELQRSPSAWHARRARLQLQARAASGEIEDDARVELQRAVLDATDPDHRLRALWCLHVTRLIGQAELVQLLHDEDEYLRAWAVQLLCEDGSPGRVAVEHFASLAEQDRSPVVRLYLAAALQRIESEEAWTIAEQLVVHREDEDDHNIPKLLWFGLEPLVAKSPERALKLAAKAQLSLVVRHIGHRLADADRFELLVQAMAEAENPLPLLLGVRDGLEGRYDVPPPEGWQRTLAHLERQSDEVASVARQLSQQFGDTQAIESMMAVLQAGDHDLAEKRQALRGLAGRRYPPLKAQLVRLLDNPALRNDAIRAFPAFDDRNLARALLQRYDSFDPESKLETIHALASRSNYGRLLSDAIRDGDIPRRDVPAYVARLLRRVVGTGFVEVWGPIDELSLDKEAAFSKFRELLTADTLATADLRHGRAIFARTCEQCHQLYDSGGRIGPELTGANRGNLEYLLSNILTPSVIIQDAYKMSVILTEDGRVYNGILAGENERQIELLVAGRDEPITIPKSAIESQEIAPVSMMPEGLLQNLKNREVIDLFGYLQSTEPVRSD